MAEQFIVDPKEDSKSGTGGGAIKRPGDKVLKCTGWTRRVSSNNNKMVEARFVCVDDLNETNDEGNGLFNTFVFSDNAKWAIANYAEAVTWQGKFDCLNDKELDAVLTNDYVVANVKIEEYQKSDGKLAETPKVFYFESFEGKIQEHWGQMIAKDETWYADFAQERADNGSSSQPRAQNTSGGDPTGGQQNDDPMAGRQGGDPGYTEEDVPF